MTAIVDVQGFRTESNYFIPKEIAILWNNKIQVFLITPPFPYRGLTEPEKRQVNWIERNRKIYWSEGFVPYVNYLKLVEDILKDKCVYTKGREKILWLKEISNNKNVNNLEDKDCPSLISLYKKYEDCHDLYSCIYHDSICALKNVLCLNKWCIDNKILL